MGGGVGGGGGGGGGGRGGGGRINWYTHCSLETKGRINWYTGTTRTHLFLVIPGVMPMLSMRSSPCICNRRSPSI